MKEKINYINEVPNIMRLLLFFTGTGLFDWFKSFVSKLYSLPAVGLHSNILNSVLHILQTYNKLCRTNKNRKEKNFLIVK